MGIFFKKAITVNQAINRSRTEKNSVLIDVRSRDEFKERYISGSINIPMDQLDSITSRIPDKTKQVFVVGSYSSYPSKAVKKLKKLGYKNTIEGGCMEDHHGIMKHD